MSRVNAVYATTVCVLVFLSRNICFCTELHPLSVAARLSHYIGFTYLCQGLLNQTEGLISDVVVQISKPAQMHSKMSQSTFFVCFAIVYYSFLLGWLLMRNATLSCITFPWMNIRALWSFQAVGVKFLCQSVTQPQFCPEYCWAANPHTLPLSANHALPILAKQTLTLQLACSNYHPPTLEWVRTEPILLQPSLQPLFPPPLHPLLAPCQASHLSSSTVGMGRACTAFH